MLGASESDLLSPAEFVALTILGSAGIAALLSAFIRPVPRDSAAFVIRGGRVRRTHGQGIVVLLPLVDKVERISLRPTTVEPLVVRTQTKDGLHVIVTASAVLRVVDLDRAAWARPSVAEYVADELERLMSAAIKRLELADLTDGFGRRLRVEVREQGATLADAGVDIDWLDVESVEVTADSMAVWADSRDGHASRR